MEENGKLLVDIDRATREDIPIQAGHFRRFHPHPRVMNQ